MIANHITYGMVKERIAVVLVILLFPGFYLYNTGLAEGWFSQFLGGWYGPVSLIVGLPFIGMLGFDLLIKKGRLKDRVGFFVSILVTYYALWASANTMLDSYGGQGLQSYFYVIEFLLLWIVTFSAFKYFDYSSKLVFQIIVILWFAMLMVAIMDQRHGMYYAAGDYGSDTALRISSYQGFARSALVVSALILARLRSWKMLAIGAASLVLLFLLGARTEFIGILLILAASFFVGRGHWLGKVSLAMILLAALIASAFYFEAFIDKSRIANLLSIGQDESWHVRKQFGSYAISIIRDNWLFGAYSSPTPDGGVGTYAHNALSAWVSFGLIGFLLFVGLNVACFIYMLQLVIRGGFKTDGVTKFAFAMSCYTLVCMIFAKSVADPIFSVAWGAVAAVAMTRNGGRVVSTAALASFRNLNAGANIAIHKL